MEKALAKVMPDPLTLKLTFSSPTNPREAVTLWLPTEDLRSVMEAVRQHREN